MSADSALAGMVAGMARTVVRRPGEREQVVVELATAGAGVVMVMVMLGQSQGSEGEKRAEES